MIVLNKTNVVITIDVNNINPEEARDVYDDIFGATHIHSDIGSVVVLTENRKRKFKCYGKLFAAEGSTIDENGLKDIVVFHV